MKTIKELTKEDKFDIRVWHWAGRRHSWIAGRFNITKADVGRIVFTNIWGGEER